MVQCKGSFSVQICAPTRMSSTYSARPKNNWASYTTVVLFDEAREFEIFRPNKFDAVHLIIIIIIVEMKWIK